MGEGYRLLPLSPSFMIFLEQAGGVGDSQSGDGDVQPRVSSHATLIQNECLSHTSAHMGAAAPPHPSHIRRHALNTPHKQQHKCRTAHVRVGAFHMRRRGPVCCAWPSDCPHTTSVPRDTRQGTRNTRDQQGGWGVAVMHLITKRQILLESLMDPELEGAKGKGKTLEESKVLGAVG